MTDTFIGLDLSLSSTGYAKIDTQIVGGTTHELKTFKTKPADFPNDIERLLFIAKELNDRILQDVKLVCMEDYYVPQSAAQMGSAIMLVQLGTIVRLRLYERHIPVMIVSPSTLKKWVSGKGNIKKDMMLREVFKRFGYDCKDDNQADAAGLAHIAMHIGLLTSGNPCVDYPVFQKEVAERLIKEGKRYNCAW
jgi:Holliday junction resolvasome RuvABC endonuclease subunit